MINDPIYGQINITDPVLIELIQTPAMQRLKGVDQNVTGRLVDLPWGKYSRFDHSIGVMWLIKLLGGSLEEQVAGLLHDISHTAFSHAMDFVFGSRETQDFHEKHIQRIVKQSHIPEILKNFGYNLERILDHHNFTILEQDIPALCADRVDYALKTFQQTQHHPVAEVKTFLNYLALWDGKIIFIDQSQAHKFASWFLLADRNAWGGYYLCNAAYQLFSQIVKRAYERGIITLDDFFTTDEGFLAKLDKESREEIEKISHLNIQEVGPNDDYDLHLNAKIRYVDPLVKISPKRYLRKLSEIDPEFRKELESALIKRRQGNYVKIIS